MLKKSAGLIGVYRNQHEGNASRLEVHCGQIPLYKRIASIAEYASAIAAKRIITNRAIKSDFRIKLESLGFGQYFGRFSRVRTETH